MLKSRIHVSLVSGSVQPIFIQGNASDHDDIIDGRKFRRPCLLCVMLVEERVVRQLYHHSAEQWRSATFEPQQTWQLSFGPSILIISWTCANYHRWLRCGQAAGHDRMDWLWRKSSHMPQAQGWICLDDSPDDHIPRPSWEAHTYSLRTLGQMWWRTKTWLAFGVFGMVFEKCLGCIKSSRLSLIIAMYAELPLLQGDVNLATDVSWSMTQVGMGSKNDIFEMEAYHKIHEFYSFIYYVLL